MSREKINAYLGLIGDLDDKVVAVEAIARKAHALGQDINSISGKIPEEKMMAAAGYLHHFYGGIKDILARIVKTVDGHLPESGDWHGELLYTASRKTPGIRPALIPPDLYEVLNEYKAFRHLFRHAYAKELRWRKMDHLVVDIEDVWSLFRNSITEFIAFLQAIVNDLEGPSGDQS